MTVPASFASIPDELLARILEDCLFFGDTLSAAIDHVDHTHGHAQFAQRQAFFAVNTVVVCREFYRIGMGILWKVVVVRSPKNLRDLVQKAKARPTNLPDFRQGRNTVRLDMRICGDYDDNLFSTLLQHMPALRIFILRTTTYEPPYEFPLLGSTIHQSLVSNCPNLARLDLLSTHELPSDDQLRTLLASKACLLTLVVGTMALDEENSIVHITDDDHGSEDKGPTLDADLPLPPPHPLSSSLTSLSIGFGEWDLDMEDTRCDIDSIETLLGDRRLLPHLTVLHFLTRCLSMRPLCRTFAPRLTELLCVAPDLMTMSASRCHLLDWCPEVEHFLWVLTDGPWFLGPRLRVLPAHHAKLAKITVLFTKEHVGEQSRITAVEQAAQHIYNQDFPALQEVCFQQRHDDRYLLATLLFLKPVLTSSSSSSDVQLRRWLDNIRHKFRKKNVAVYLET